MSDNDINKQKNEFAQTIKGTSLNQDAWKRLKKNKMAIVSLYIIALYALISLTAAWLPIHSYKRSFMDHAHLPPSITKTAGELLIEKKKERLIRVTEAEKRLKSPVRKKALKKKIKKIKIELEALDHKIKTETAEVDGKIVKFHERKYLFGTDYLGRDLLARIIYGGQISIAIGILGSLTTMLIGVVVGSISGYIGGKVDNLIMRIVDVMYGLPYILLVIIFMAFFGQHILNLFFAIAVVSWLTIARVVRGQIISIKNSEYVEAARSIGASNKRIIFKHMVPNTIGIIIVFATLEIPLYILAEAFLSFLGLGISAPFSSWGSLVQDAVDGLEHYPWALFFPAITMTAFLFAMNFLGDGLRDAFDPQSKNRI